MRDSALGLWLRLLALHIEEPGNDESPARQIRDQFLLASDFYEGGCTPHGLEEATCTEEGFAIVVNAVRSLTRALSKRHGTIKKEEINLLGFSSTYKFDCDVAKLLEIAQAFQDLLDGKITCTVRESDFIPGGIIL